MIQLTIEEIKAIQLEILNAVHEFCIENNIVYSLACGSLLGAVRHKGYIPWDDDIDIYLLRNDFEKLVSYFPKSYKTRYELVSLERDLKWDRAYAKAYDNRTILIEKEKYDETIGLGIDVYPIDDVPNDDHEWKRYDLKRRLLQKIYEISFTPISPERNLLKNALLAFFKLFLLPFNQRRIAEFIDRFSKVNNNLGYDYVFENCQGVIAKRKFLKSCFSSITQIDFEGKKFNCFSNYDEYLKNNYGDYMKLPPIEKRIRHHNFLVYWKDN